MSELASTAIDWRPVESAAALQLMAIPGDLVFPISSLVQASLETALRAEVMACQLGIVPWAKLPNGEKGVITPGKATSCDWSAHPNEGAMYQAAMTQIQGLRKYRPADMVDLPEQLGLPPLVWALIVFGSMAILATSYTIIETQRGAALIASNEHLALAQANLHFKLAQEELKATGKVNPAYYAGLPPIAANGGLLVDGVNMLKTKAAGAAADSLGNLPWYLLGGAVLVGGGIWLAGRR